MNLKNSHRNRYPYLAKALALGIAAVKLTVVTQAQTTWDGGGGTSILNTATNWTTDTLPTTSATWDGTQAGGLSLSWNANIGDITNGMSLNVNTGQTGSVSLNAADGTSALSLSTITTAASTGALTIGNGDATAATVNLRGTNTFTNNNTGNAVTFASDVVFGSGGGSARTIQFAGSGNWVFNSGLYIAGTGSVAINVNSSTGLATVTLNAASAKAAVANTITAGTLSLTNGDALGNSGSANLTIQGGAGTKRLSLSNNISLNSAVNVIISGKASSASEVITDAAIMSSGDNSIQGNVTFGGAGGTYSNINSQSGTLTLNGATMTAATVTGTRNINFAGPGNIVVNSAITDGSATLGISNTGSGTTTLNNGSTYSGGTTVTTGKFLVNNTTGSGTGTGAVSVTGGTFGGTGSISGALTVNSTAILAPGAGGIESLGTGALTLNTGSQFSFEVNTTTSTADLLFTNGSLNLNGTVTLNLTDLGSNTPVAAGTKFTLISYNTSWNNGIFNGHADGSIISFAGTMYVINYQDTTAGINFNSDAIASGTSFVTLTAIAIPEPATYGIIIGLACCGGALVMQRRRRAV